jgi:YggT family protein
MIWLAEIVYRLFQLLVVIVVIDVILSYFLSPWNEVRMILDRVVEPMLRPIRRFIPSMSGLDFSPLVLIILLQIIGSVLRRLILSL